MTSLAGTLILAVGVAVGCGCAQDVETATKVHIDENGTLFTLEDELNDDHHVSCGPYVDHVSFWGYPNEQELWSQFQIAVDIGFFVEEGDTLDIPGEARVRVLAPSAATEGDAVELEKGEVEVVIADGGLNSAHLLIEIHDGANAPLATFARGTIDCWWFALSPPNESEPPISDTQSGGDDDDLD